MSKRHADSTPDEKAPHSTTLSADSVLVEAARNGDTTAVRVGLEKLSPDTDSKTVAFDAVHEACRGNHDECLALLLPYVETTQIGFGMLLSERIHADHTACTEVLLQRWKSVCSNVAFVPHGQGDRCPAMWEDPAVFQVLIDAGADIETKDENGRSPLHKASTSGALDVVKMLVKAGADVRVTDNDGDTRDDEGETCLTLAAANGHTETVRYLVSLEDVDVNHSGEDGFTALHWAGQQNSPEVVQVLIDAGADIETKDEKGRSPLHKACTSGALDVVKMLVEAGANVCVTDYVGETCLLVAAGNGHTETVRYLVSLKDVDVNHSGDNGFTALHWAGQGNYPEVVQLLIDAGADIETKDDEGCSPLLREGRSPLHVSSCSGKLAVMKVLVKAGADVCVTDNQGNTCLTLAAVYGHTKTVRYLVGLNKVDVNHKANDGDSAVLSVARVTWGQTHAVVMQVLIDAGADIEAKGVFGGSPLVVSCSKGNLNVAKVLIKAGAEVFVSDNYGATCLMYAARNGHTETVRYLVSLEDMDLMIINHSGVYGFTALHCAAKNYPEVVQVLIDVGADIETKDENGRSPLHKASCSGALDVVKMLVEAGAEVCATDNEGDTCLTLAARNGHAETVRYLVGLPEVDVHHAANGGETELHVASRRHGHRVEQVLLDPSSEVTPVSMHPS